MNTACYALLVKARERGLSVREYRRGIELKGSTRLWQKLWHSDESCRSYPLRNYMIRKDLPPEDELCSRCGLASS